MIPTQLQNKDFRFILLRPKNKEPIESDWQKSNNYTYDDKKLLNHIKRGGNYGVVGGYGNLIILDADSDEITKIGDTLAETLTIQSSQAHKKHFYFIANKKVKPIRLTADKIGDLGDVRSVGQYVVGPNCNHPKGMKYKIIVDKPLVEITEDIIRNVFENYIDKDVTTEFKEYPVQTALRSSRYIKHCEMPDYLINHKLPKGNTAKNWKLFRYVADILHNRQATQSVYQNIANKQGHSEGAIKGWAIKGKEGKLGKSSCKIMRDYIKKYYPEQLDFICGNCPLNKKYKDIENVVSDSYLSDLQKEIYILLIQKKVDDATERIVDYLKKKHYIYTTRDDDKSEMWIYDKGIYIPEGKSRLKEEVRYLLGKVFKNIIVNNIILKIEADTGIDKKEFFEAASQNILEIPLENGLFNLKENELYPFNPNKIFFNKLPVKYDPDATCPNIEQHFKDVLKSEDDAEVMHELFGYLLWKDHFIEKGVMMVGNGRNGKTKTIELMKRFLGAENCISIPLETMQGDNFIISGLFGKMANLAGDLNNTSLKDTGKFKQITGRDIITANRKFKTPISFINYSKQIFACNELPRVYDSSLGFWSRWILFEFPYTFLSESEYLKSELATKKRMNPDQINKITSESELSGLFNKAVEKLQDLLKNKEFSYSRGTNSVKQFWVRKSNSFAAFCMDCLEENYESNISKKDLRRAFKKYTKEHQVPGVSDRAIKVTLEEEFGVTDERKWNKDREEQISVWEGIKFKKNTNLGFLGGKLAKNGEY